MKELKIMAKYNKHNEEQKAIDEAMALVKQGRRERPRRLRLITGSYSKMEFDKLFATDRYHKGEK